MSFLMQMPDASDLADAIEAACVDATDGGGMFAFASRRGIERFFSIRSVRTMLEAGGSFDLIVGTDAITNADALLCLEEIIASYRSLRVLGFVHGTFSTFHPKLCWFSSEKNTQLIVGSGNLTSSGLGREKGSQKLGNWEALVTRSLHNKEATETIASLRKWIQSSIESRNLLSITSDTVRARGVANSRVKYIKPRQELGGTRDVAPRAAVELQERVVPRTKATVLVREVPINRSGQADITKAGLEFFGFSGEPKKVLIQHVGLNNLIGEVAERLLFVNASNNYRIEITEVAEQKYVIGPDNGRMVLVAVKLDDSAFRYTVVPVDSEDYEAMNDLLGPIPTDGRRLMRIRLTDVPTLKSIWRRAPAHLLPVVEVSVEDVD